MPSHLILHFINAIPLRLEGIVSGDIPISAPLWRGSERGKGGGCLTRTFHRRKTSRLNVLQDSTSNLLSDTEPQAVANCSMLLLWLTASEDHLFVLCPCRGLKALHLGRGCSQGVGFALLSRGEHSCACRQICAATGARPGSSGHQLLLLALIADISHQKWELAPRRLACEVNCVMR